MNPDTWDTPGKTPHRRPIFRSSPQGLPPGSRKTSAQMVGNPPKSKLCSSLLSPRFLTARMPLPRITRYRINLYGNPNSPVVKPCDTLPSMSAMTLPVLAIFAALLSAQTTPAPLPQADPNTRLAEQSAMLGKVRGVVTYYFNDNYGDKGDIGSEVYLVAGDLQLPPPASEVSLSKSEVQIVYPLSKLEQKENRASLKNKSPLPNAQKVTTMPVVDYTTVDANGAFQFEQVAPGRYTIVLRSSHSVPYIPYARDRGGRLACVQVEVRAARSTDASYKFPANGLAGGG